MLHLPGEQGLNAMGVKKPAEAGKTFFFKVYE
jgi:hypothetical protein